LGQRIPEESVLVLLREILEQAAPAAVKASRVVADGELLEAGFRVLATPGHPAGHVAYLHEPSGSLFCGDALAVVGGHLQLMARPVTPDLMKARASALRCLYEDAKFICPGHRGPLVANVKEKSVPGYEST
jgi:glyoxylase-like metal-dependent hydrolase (beta-lactamase superfamily II)